MSRYVRICLDGVAVGQIEPLEARGVLQAVRTAEGFDIRLPAQLTLVCANRDQLQPLVSNLRVAVSVRTEDGTEFDVGLAADPSFYPGLVPEGVFRLSLQWRGPLKVLALLEKLRNGKPLRLGYTVKGEICGLVQLPNRRHRLRTDPQYIHGSVEVEYPADVWVMTMRNLGVVENVLVEIPLPGSRPAPWDDVWKALVEARDGLERGGATGWKTCVTGVRLALEKWQQIEKEDMGPGWKAPTPNERQQRTKRQRVDNLRWHVLQLAHLAPHTSAEEWSREDALLLLATLSAWLAQRKP